MQALGILETTAPPVPCALAMSVVVFLPSGGSFRLAATALAAGLLLLAWRTRRLGSTCSKGNWGNKAGRCNKASKGCFRLYLALAAGLALGALSHFRADAAASAGGGGFLQTIGQGSPRFTLVAIEGRVVSDARRASGGLSAGSNLSYAELAILGIHGADQAWVGATGRLTVFVRGACAPPRGSTVLVRCRPPADLRPVSRARVFVDKADVTLLKPASRADSLRLGMRVGLLSALGKAGGEAGPLLEALFLGVRDELDTSLVSAFRDAGCAHILALSGQHVAVLAGLTAVLLGPLLGKGRAKPGACILAALYLALVGPMPSVTRSIFMFWTAAALAAADRPQQSGTILAIVFISAALIEPPSVRSLSFQLSYLAVAGIAAFSPGLDFFIRRWIPPALSGVLAVGLASLAATAPLSILVFGRLNPFSPLVSALAGLLVACLMWMGVFLAPVVAILPVTQPVVSLLFLLPFRLLSWLMTVAASLPAFEFAQGPSRLAASVAVALACALVYAWPHARYQFQRSRHHQHAPGQFLPGYRIKGFHEPGRHEPGGRKWTSHNPGPGSVSGGLQLPQGSVRPAGDSGACHAQEVRPELPHQQHCQASHRGAP
jgi:competence protein ComEC